MPGKKKFCSFHLSNGQALLRSRKKKTRQNNSNNDDDDDDDDDDDELSVPVCPCFYLSTSKLLLSVYFKAKLMALTFKTFFSQNLFGKLFCASVEASILTKIKICDAVERITGWF